MKLFIDDCRDRPDTSWTLARTINEAIYYIAHFEWDSISLDYDISMLVDVDGTHRPFPSKETFMAVAYYICEKYRTATSFILTVTIHSANPVGAENMRKLFKDRGIVAIINPSSRVNRL